MKILYVTGMCAPIKDILTGKTENEITGTPGFFYPWFKLVQRGHQVDMIVLSNFDEEPRIAVDWFDERNLIVNIYDPVSDAAWYGRIFRRVKRFLKIIYFTNKALRKDKYDFVYCKAVYEGLAGNIVANLRGVPSGMRSFGTMAFADLKKHGVAGAAIRNPLEFMTYKIRKKFFIMTDDGTKGDVVYEKWKPKKGKYEFYFWKTGINIKSIEDLESTLAVPQHDYLFFAARIESWKRHDRVLNILHQLHQKKKYLHLYFAGPTQSQGFLDSIRALASEFDLSEFVHFLGPIKQDDVKRYAYHAIANPLMYDHSNLGNVFFETFSTGAIIIGLNDGSLDEYLVHNENGFIVNNEDEAALIIDKLTENKTKANIIRDNAIDCARQKFLSIDERFDMEVDLIEQTVESHRAKKQL